MAKKSYLEGLAGRFREAQTKGAPARVRMHSADLPAFLAEHPITYKGVPVVVDDSVKAGAAVFDPPAPTDSPQALLAELDRRMDDAVAGGLEPRRVVLHQDDHARLVMAVGGAFAHEHRGCALAVDNKVRPGAPRVEGVKARKKAAKKAKAR